MNRFHPFIILSLLLFVSCQQNATRATGDLQYFELKGNVARLEDEGTFPGHAVSFDESGHIVLPVEPEIIEANSEDDYYPKASYPLTRYSWYEEDEDYNFSSVSLLYDSDMRLLEIGFNYTSGTLQYDEKGRIQAYCFEDEGEEGKISYKYDDSGNRIEEETVGEFIYEKRIYDEYEFDSHGNWISRKWTQIDQDGAVVAEGRQNRKGKILYW